MHVLVDGLAQLGTRINSPISPLPRKVPIDLLHDLLWHLGELTQRGHALPHAPIDQFAQR